MVLLNVLPDCVVKLSPVVFGLFVAIHENVDAVLPVNGMLTVPPLQMVAVAALVMVGRGFTITGIVAVSVHNVPGLMIRVTVKVSILA